MISLVDDLTFPIQCPKCGHEIEQSVDGLKDDPKLTCPYCGQSLQLQSGGSGWDIAQQLDDLDVVWDMTTKG